METEESPTGTRTRSPAFGVIDGRLPPGVVLAGRYRIVGLLGRGGMGEVYRADDLKLRQAVALKFLPPSVAGDRRLARFYDEVRIAREVSHPNVCRVHDLGEADGHHFLSMEYVDGEDLASLLRRIGRLPADKGLEIARQLCAGLAAAHEKGVLHRDLKPANVMIDGRGRVRLTDFGIADLAERIRSGTGAGTPAYMAPEQFAGREVSVRSDVYSLGLVL
jgi:serine/threonine-protein kinase